MVLPILDWWDGLVLLLSHILLRCYRPFLLHRADERILVLLLVLLLLPLVLIRRALLMDLDLLFRWIRRRRLL